ncbi:MAG: transcription termination/antitermination factor NusG [Acidobacteria bacterium]|nr:transcription termination/antitermination factor NusG [Acidobacteriota bacterium]
MSEFETDNLEDVIESDDDRDLVDTDTEVFDDEPVVESAADRPGEWYVVRCFSGHEKKVSDALMTLIENQGLQNEIYEIVIPEEDVIEIRREKRVTVKKKTLPGYMLVRCEPSIENFQTITSIPSAIGFVGPQQSNPIPLERDEIDNLIRPTIEGLEQPVRKKKTPRHEFEVGNEVEIKTGPFATFKGFVAEINDDQMKLKVLVDIFGRETPVELEFNQVTKS